MIKKIRLRNFYSFADTEINLDAGASVLVGINGSGKSNLLRAIRLLKEGVAGMGLRRYVIDELGGLDNIQCKSGSPRDQVVLEFDLDFEGMLDDGWPSRIKVITYRIALGKRRNSSNYFLIEHASSDSGAIFLDFQGGEGHFGEFLEKELANGEYHDKYVHYENFVDSSDLALSKIFDNQKFFVLSTIRKAISEIMVYDYFDTTPSSKIRRPMLPTSEKQLLPDGSNLPQILNTIKINSKQSYNKIAAKISDVNPNFKGIDFNFLGGNIELMMEEQDFNTSVHVSAISDGTLRYLCLLSILFNPNRGRFICIDEPEVGLHPDMLFLIGNAILEAAEESSFLISTHSENILNCFDIEQIRVLEKDGSNTTVVSEYTKEDFAGWYEHFSVGKMWRAGDLGGNR